MLQKRLSCRSIACIASLFCIASAAAEDADFASDTPAFDEDAVTVMLEPRHKATLSTEVTARVLDVQFERGETFDEGEILVELEKSLYEAERNNAAASLESAQALLKEITRLQEQKTAIRKAQAVLDAAMKELDRVKRMQKDGRASDTQFQVAIRDRDVAQADLEFAESNIIRDLAQASGETRLAEGHLRIAETRLAACTIRAPYPGRIVEQYVQEHELLERGMPLLQIVDDRVLLARFFLPTKLFPKVRKGLEVPLTILSTDETVTATISHISAIMDAGSLSFEVFAEIDNSAGSLRGGMNARLSMTEIRRLLE